MSTATSEVGEATDTLEGLDDEFSRVMAELLTHKVREDAAWDNYLQAVPGAKREARTEFETLRAECASMRASSARIEAKRAEAQQWLWTQKGRDR